MKEIFSTLPHSTCALMIFVYLSLAISFYEIASDMTIHLASLPLSHLDVLDDDHCADYDPVINIADN